MKYRPTLTLSTIQKLINLITSSGTRDPELLEVKNSFLIALLRAPRTARAQEQNLGFLSPSPEKLQNPEEWTPEQIHEFEERMKQKLLGLDI